MVHPRSSILSHEIVSMYRYSSERHLLIHWDRYAVKIRWDRIEDRGCSIVSYADDTAVISEGITWNDALVKMSQLLAQIGNWLAINKLSLNIEKSLYITFGNYCNSIPELTELKLESKQLKRV